jgi:hypothetical protein
LRDQPGKPLPFVHDKPRIPTGKPCPEFVRDNFGDLGEFADHTVADNTVLRYFNLMFDVDPNLEKRPDRFLLQGLPAGPFRDGFAPTKVEIFPRHSEPNTCKVCVFLFVDVDDDHKAYRHILFAKSGTLSIDSYKPGKLDKEKLVERGQMEASFRDVIMVEVVLRDGIYWFLPDGCGSRFDRLHINTASVPETAARSQ